MVMQQMHQAQLKLQKIFLLRDAQRYEIPAINRRRNQEASFWLPDVWTMCAPLNWNGLSNDMPKNSS